MCDGGKVYRNSYLLINGGYAEGLGYFIGVQPRAGLQRRLEVHARESRASGSELTVSVPANYFPTAEHAVKHLLIAGGIGNTPLLAHRSHLKLLEQRVEPPLHLPQCRDWRPSSRFWSSRATRTFISTTPAWDISSTSLLIRRQPEGTHLYTCGPAGLMDAAINAVELLGWPAESIHVVLLRRRAPEGR